MADPDIYRYRGLSGMNAARAGNPAFGPYDPAMGPQLDTRGYPILAKPRMGIPPSPPAPGIWNDRSGLVAPPYTIPPRTESRFPPGPLGDQSELTPIDQRPSMLPPYKAPEGPSLVDSLKGLWGDITGGEFAKYNPYKGKKSGEQLYMESITPGKRSESGTDIGWMGLGPEEEAEAAAEAEASGGVSVGGAGDIRVPTFKPGSSQAPDWGEVPDAPVFAGPDYTKANEYFEAAKPKPYEEDPWDVRAATLAGLASGFSPEGTVGEILGRMAGPGFGAYAGAKEQEEEQQREAEDALNQWNASMGEQAGHQAGTTAETANLNTQAVYDNALQKRDALIQQSEWVRDEDREQFDREMQQADLELAIASENRQAAQDQWTRENTGGGFEMEDDIYQGFTRGYIPGFEGDIQGFKTQVAKEETERLAIAAEAGDASAKELLQRQTLDPSGWQKYVDGVAYSQFRQQLGQ